MHSDAYPGTPGIDFVRLATEHIPDDDWACRACGDDWPCGAAWVAARILRLRGRRRRRSGDADPDDAETSAPISVSGV